MIKQVRHCAYYVIGGFSMDILQQNLLYLKQHHNSIFCEIEFFLAHSNNEKRCKLIESDTGDYNLSYVTHEGIFLLYDDDRRDILNWIDSLAAIKSEEYDVIMYGLGLTHHVAELIQLNSELNFYIIEPDIDIFLETLKIINIEKLLEHPQIKLFEVGDSKQQFNDFAYLANLYSLRRRVHAFIPYYSNLDKKKMSEFYEFVYGALSATMIQIGFENTFGTLPYLNSIRNIEYLYKSHNLNILKNQFEGCAALVVGAGPSLEHDIQKIKAVKDNVLIIAAGTSIQTLLHYGLEPHLIVSMDPGEANGRAFSNVDIGNIPLVFVNQIYTEILECHPVRNYHAYFTGDGVLQYLLGDMELSPILRTNLSVSGTATQVAYYLGAKTIIYTGQDLSFPNKQYYSKGAKHFSEEKLNSLMTSRQLTVENVSGGTNETNQSMILTLEDIEKLIEDISDVKFINCSSLGAKIKGADFIPFDVATQNTASGVYSFNKISEIAESNEFRNEFNLNDLLNKIDTAIRESKQLKDQCNISINTIKKIDELSRRYPAKAMSLLGKLEEQFSVVTENEMFKKIITSWNRSLTREYDQHVMKVQEEPTIIGKSKLLMSIVYPYIQNIIESFDLINTEFILIHKKLMDMKQN